MCKGAPNTNPFYYMAGLLTDTHEKKRNKKKFLSHALVHSFHFTFR